MNRQHEPRLRKFDVYECVDGRWLYAETIQAPSEDAAAQEWIHTGTKIKFRIKPHHSTANKNTRRPQEQF